MITGRTDSENAQVRILNLGRALYRYREAQRYDAGWVGANGRLARELIAHRTAVLDASMNVTVDAGEGVEEDVVRTVSENATALKFDHASFEKD